MKKYIEILENQFQEEKEWNESLDNKIEFIGSSIFNFTTYDGSMDECFALKMLDVVDCIVKKETFKYQVENYENYLLMVNMPFLKDKLEWGTSIRGAWFDKYGHHSEKEPRVYDVNDIIIPKAEIEDFILQLIEWSKNP